MPLDDSEQRQLKTLLEGQVQQGLTLDVANLFGNFPESPELRKLSDKGMSSIFGVGDETVSSVQELKALLEASGAATVTIKGWITIFEILHQSKFHHFGIFDFITIDCERLISLKCFVSL